ncbi:MAG TPA: TetR/AcrR family transcriptional regulator [Amaricoccus sp.]|uniref:TetR/AcrR family transcriptional regulator n=1 Tax=Amaricoccus sp. TaxID=1872485 RepID=UPI001D2DD945|nr:TetR/AcrR family transcriptional regulator [Amaricoccus sp.]MCB1373398.1 TetR/AcrR family transcriptional regulator [Paracoccaceae bacterium]HPG23479.1 TetR/AcrR family transcriptional regulator [Amaricoccus sp.]HRW14310.1 TetR/AcrR family transcriptional regulator [Amaricoccus sp.]
MARTRASDFEEKQHGILLGAAAVFAEQGMEKASMAQIASQLNVSKALLYHYYPSKDDLIFAIIHTHLVELEACVAAAIDDALPPEDQLRVLAKIVLEKYRGADNAHKVQLVGVATLGEPRREEIREVERQIVRHFSRVLARINPALDNAERPLLMPVTMSLFGILNWAYMWFREGGVISREDYADLAMTLVLEGIQAVR